MAVRKIHTYERSEVPRRIRKFSAYEIFWIYSTLQLVHRPIPITRFPPGLPLNPTSNKHWPIRIARRTTSEQGVCLFPSSHPARYFRNEGFSLTGKKIELPWQPRPQHPFIYIGFDVRLAKSFNWSGKLFSVKTVSSVDMVRGVVFRSET